MTILDFADRLGVRLSPLKVVVLKALYHLGLTADERAIFVQHSGREYQEGETASEITLLVGRRGGKSLLSAIVALYELLRPETRAALSPGEAAVVPVISRTRDTARTVYEVAQYHARTSPLIRPLVQNTLDGTSFREIEFAYDDRNPLYLRVMPARHWAVLGRAVPCAVLDEFAFFPQEGASTDRDVVEALEPSLAQFDPHGKVVEISSPWIKGGRAFDRWRQRAELRDGFVFTATSKEFNPGLSDAFLARAQSKDPVAFTRNFMAEFTDAIDSFLDAASVDACVQAGRREVPPQPGVQYRGFLDAAFKRDRFVFVVASKHGDRMRIDLLRRWYPPVKLELVLAEIGAVVREYTLREAIEGDQFASEPMRRLLQKECGVGYKEITLTAQSKVEVFGTLKTIVHQERVELPDDRETLAELRALECRVTPAGSVQIGHPLGGGVHDDAAVTLALAAHALLGREFEPPIFAYMRERNALRKQEATRTPALKIIDRRQEPEAAGAEAPSTASPGGALPPGGPNAALPLGSPSRIPLGWRRHLWTPDELMR